MFELAQQGTVRVVKGSDPIHAANIDEISALLNDCVATGQPCVVIDLEAVPLIDSEGLELLLKTSERCQERGGCLQLASANGLCHDILRITGVAGQIGLFDDVTEAVRTFAQ